MDEAIKTMVTAGLGIAVFFLIIGFGVFMYENMKHSPGVENTSAYDILNESQALTGSMSTDWGDIIVMIFILIVVITFIVATAKLMKESVGGNR